MKIEVAQQAEGLNGGAEVWVHVFANEVHDWPSIEAKLNATQRAILNSLGPRSMSYFPHMPDTDEQGEHGYMFEDWFVWTAK